MAMEEEKKTEENAAAADKATGSILHSAMFKWAIVGVILLLFIGIEVGIAVFFVGRLKEPDLKEAQKQEEEEQKQAALRKQTEVGATLAAPIEVTVNISGEDGRFLKCGVQLEYDPAHTKLGPELDARKARIKDIVLDIMSSRPLSELMTNDGKKAIREQIVADINAILPETLDGKPLGKIERSYFDSFMIQ
jgi:flagellar FliL protein